jgi:hypothetical protein
MCNALGENVCPACGHVVYPTPEYQCSCSVSFRQACPGAALCKSMSGGTCRTQTRESIGTQQPREANGGMAPSGTPPRSSNGQGRLRCMGSLSLPSAVLSKTQGKASNLTVNTHPKPPPSEPTPASDDSAPTSGAAGAPLAGPTPVPTCPESACLENDCALTNYANALDKLWER